MLGSNRFIAILHLTASLSSVFIQLMVANVITTVFGYYPEHIVLVVGCSLAGLAFGQSGLLSLWQIRGLMFLVTLGGMTFFFWYERILLSNIPSLHILVVAYLALALLCSGVLISNAIYFKRKFTENYFVHNVLSFFFIVGYLFAQKYIGTAIPHLIVAILFSILLIFISVENVAPQNKSNFDFESFILGAISGGYACCILQSISGWLHPVGVEFQIYLCIIFFALSIAAAVRKQSIIRIGRLPTIPLTLYVAVLVVTIGGISEFYFFNPLSLYKLMPMDFQQPLIFRLLFMMALLSPYLLFAFNLPAMQSSNLRGKYLYPMTLGNCFAYAMFYVLVPAVDLQKKIIILYLFVVIHTYFFKSGYKYWLTIGLGVLSACIFLQDADKRATLQALRTLPTFLPVTRFSSLLSSEDMKLEGFRTYVKSGQSSTYLYRTEKNIRFLGIGGYSSIMYRPIDIMRAQVALDLVNKYKLSRVLVVGLGDHIVLDKLMQAPRNLSGDLRVDIIDNFKFFADENYRNLVAVDLNFKWPQPNFKYTEADAFRYMLQAEDKEIYDLIVLNVSWPTSSSSKNLYTTEYYEILKNRLSKNGFLVTEYFSTKELFCLNQRLFKSNVLVPAKFKKYVLVSSDLFKIENVGTNNNIPLYEDCDSAGVLSLAKPYWGVDLVPKGPDLVR
jgi:hypothetical protein